MSSFNTYGSRSAMVGGSVPVWLGTVTPLPAGYKVLGAEAGMKIPAGTLIEALNLADDDGNYTIPIAVPCFSYRGGDEMEGFVPCGDYGTFVPKVGFAIYNYTTNNRNDLTYVGKVTGVVRNEDGSLTITSSSSTSISGRIFITPTGDADYDGTGVYAYAYNDVVIDKDDENPQATVAAVVAHNEGLLIDRTPCYNLADEDGGISVAERLVPNVILVRG